MSETILKVEDLKTSFMTSSGEVQAVRGVSFEVHKGEILGIVGESGSGKSVTSMSILRLLADTARIKNGKIEFEGTDLTKVSDKQMREIRGQKIAMVFQDPMTSLDPTMTIGKQIMEGMLWHFKMPKAEAYKKALELLEEVGITDAEKRMKSYPHQLSGGMRQRVVIAIALACDPDLLICDEPTTALDVTIQAKILELIRSIQRERGISVIYITHDLGVVAKVADYVDVMYAGKIVETGTCRQVMKTPMHPYTKALLAAKPTADQTKGEKLVCIEGMPPSLLNPPKGCAFADRCSYCTEKCRNEQPKEKV